MSDESTNQTVSEDYQVWSDYPGWRWAFFNIIIWLMPILLSFGIIFNILCFITIFRYSKTFPKISRINMLIITGLDITVLSLMGTYYYQRYWASTFGVYLVKELKDHLHDSAVACVFIPHLFSYLMEGTPLFQVSLTTERVLAVVMPLKVKRIITVRTNAIGIVVLLIIGTIPAALRAAEFVHIDGYGCVLKDYYTVVTIDFFQFTIEFYVCKIALVIYLLSGCAIVAVTLKRRAKTAAQLSGSVDKAKQAKLVGTCAVMIFMNLAFFFTHGPRAAFSVYEGYIGLMPNMPMLTEAQYDLGYFCMYGITFLHNIIDPFGYFIGKGFRDAFWQNIRWLLCLDRLRARMRGTPGAK